MKYQEFETLLSDNSVYGLKSIRSLEPFMGPGETISPPTYANVGYQIDRNQANGESVVVLDSVGSQANRTEPIFKRKPYSKLVPQVEVTLGTRTVNLIDLGHRGADAAIRLTELQIPLQEAFEQLERKRNGVALAKIAPTSLIFGAWDSRGTQAKTRRVVRHTIEGSDVFELKRSAQYIPAVNYVKEELVSDTDIKKKAGDKNLGSKIGLLDNPATNTLGGVRVATIRRLGLLNINVIRNLKGENEEETKNLQNYLLGLALVAFTFPAELDLREGCELAPKLGEKGQLVIRKETEEIDWEADPKAILEFAQAAAEAFGVGEDRNVTFDKKLASIEIEKAMKGK